MGQVGKDWNFEILGRQSDEENGGSSRHPKAVTSGGIAGRRVDRLAVRFCAVERVGGDPRAFGVASSGCAGCIVDHDPANQRAGGLHREGNRVLERARDDGSGG